jgi:DNA-binding beta-propeller fold protein YncE
VKAPRLEYRGTYDQGAGRGTEIVTAQASTMRAIVCHESGLVDVLDVAASGKPTRLAQHRLAVRAGEILTSVSVHPECDYALVAVRAAGPVERGRILFLDLTHGTVLHEVRVGVGPDAVAVSPNGRYAVVANEAEDVTWDPRTETWASAPGSISVISLCRGPRRARVQHVQLPNLTGRRGFVQPEHGRFLERDVDRDGDGAIQKSERGVLVPLLLGTPPWLEPEYVAFHPRHGTAYVTLQENNGVLVVDPTEARIVGIFGLGTTTHPSDVISDGEVSFTDTLYALREPDGIALTPDGRYFITGDEGDTCPGPDGTLEQPTGGGRTLSVFDALTGAFVGDTGNQLAARAHEAGVYPDPRSFRRGAEPEVPIAFEFEGVPYAAVGLERSSAVALVSLEKPAAPRVTGVYPLGKGSISPEGLALVRREGKLYLLTANEISGDVTVFEVVR